MARPLSNYDKERAAVAFVMEFERRSRRGPVRDVRHTGAAYDVRSRGRRIEVKAIGKAGKPDALLLQARQVLLAEKDPKFFVYVVCNTSQEDSGKFTLKVLDHGHLMRLLGRRREQIYFEVPWPSADYRATPFVE